MEENRRMRIKYLRQNHNMIKDKVNEWLTENRQIYS